MSKILIAFFLVFLTSQVQAQQSDTVLVCFLNYQSEADKMKTIVEKYYDGPVHATSLLPDNLGSFRAVIVRGLGGLATADQIILTSYLEQGGKLLVIDRSTRMTEYGDLQDPLWNRVRDTAFYEALTASASKSVSGVKGTFAEGFFMSNPSYNEHDVDLGGMREAIGLSPILFENGDLYRSEAAHVSIDTSLKFVFFCPQNSYFVESFIGLTLCNYFQLCTLEVKTGPIRHAEIRYNPITRELHFPKEGMFEIFDLLGRCVMSKSHAADRFRLSFSIPPGAYLIKWQEKSAASVKLILIQ